MQKLLLALLLGCTSKASDTAASGPLDSGPKDTGTEELDPLAQIDPGTLPAGASPCREPAYVHVDEVVDGDTARVSGGRGVERVRFIGIDAAEVDHDGDWDECWAEEARAHVVDRIEGVMVWMSFDSECEDDYGRTLAYLHTRPGDQGFLQRGLLSEGWVETFAVSPNTTFAAQFSQDESAASGAGLGLWGACGR